MTETRRLSVVIETLNLSRQYPGSWQLFRDALEAPLAALEGQTIGRDSLEIIIVADADFYEPITRFVAERAPYVTCLLAPGLHYYAQKNFGAKWATTPLVAFLDSDCVPVPTWAETIVTTLEKEPNVGAVQGVLRTDRSPWGVALLVAAFGNYIGDVPRDCLSFPGNSCSFRRSEFLAAPFVEEPLFSGPEAELASRILGRGQKIRLHPGAAVSHYVEPGLKAFAEFIVYAGWTYTRVRQKNSEVRFAGLFRALGPLAIPLIVPAKAARDLAVMSLRGGTIDAPLVSKVGGLLLLMAMAPLYGWGAFKQYLGEEVPTPVM